MQVVYALTHNGQGVGQHVVHNCAAIMLKQCEGVPRVIGLYRGANEDDQVFIITHLQEPAASDRGHGEVRRYMREVHGARGQRGRACVQVPKDAYVDVTGVLGKAREAFCKPLQCTASLISDKHKMGMYFIAVRVSFGVIHGEHKRECTFVAVRVSWGNKGSGSGIYR